MHRPPDGLDLKRTGRNDVQNIKTLFNFEPPATEVEISASSLQFVRKAATHRDALADVVVELMNSGLDYYFMQPLNLAKAGFIVQSS